MKCRIHRIDDDFYLMPSEDVAYLGWKHGDKDDNREYECASPTHFLVGDIDGKLLFNIRPIRELDARLRMRITADKRFTGQDIIPDMICTILTTEEKISIYRMSHHGFTIAIGQYVDSIPAVLLLANGEPK